MTWQSDISASPTLWRATQEYCELRITEITAICTSSASSDLEIRQAQARIAELQRLLDLPTQLATEAKARAQMTSRKEY